MDRRSFLKTACAFPLFHVSLLSAETRKTLGNSVQSLILLELKGGNDGLNTLIPYKETLYNQCRPNLAILEKNIIPLNTQVGMHPALSGLGNLWEKGLLAWLQGVGYSDPNRSHFESIEKWDTASLHDETTEGWVSQLLHGQKLKGVAIDSSIGPLATEDLSSIGLIDPIQFAKIGSRIKTDSSKANATMPDALQHVLKVQQSVHNLSHQFLTQLEQDLQPKIPFPQHAFGRHMQAVYRLMLSDLGIPVYKVSLGNFDTHVNQLGTHEKLLTVLDETLSIFVQNVQAAGLWDNTLIVTYSEFGRRLQENANRGTDHGSAAPHFVTGGKVKGGLYGTYPSLEKLDKRGDLIYTTDFRNVYASIAEKWWKLPQKIGDPTLNFL